MQTIDHEETAIAAALKSSKPEAVTTVQMSVEEAWNLIDEVPEEIAYALDIAQGEAKTNGCEAYVLIQILPR